MTDIRPATAADWPGLWEIFRAVVATGDTYPYGPDTTEEEAKGCGSTPRRPPTWP